MEPLTSHRYHTPSASNTAPSLPSPPPHHSSHKQQERQQHPSQYPSIRRLRSCYESALKMLHVRASRRVAPLAVENSNTQEQNDRSATPNADHHRNTTTRHYHHDNSNALTIAKQPSSAPCSPASFTSSYPPNSNTPGSTASKIITSTSPPETRHEHEENECQLQSNSNSTHTKQPSIHTSMSANGVLNKVLTRTKSTSRSLVTMASSSEKSSQRHYFAKLQHKHFRIYIKAPHYVAGGQVSGTVVVNLPQHCSLLIPDALDGIESFTFRLVGTEDIHDQANYNPATHTHHFLKVPIFDYGRDVLAANYYRNGALKIPFTVQLPVDLGASYADKKAQVRYSLQTEMILDCAALPGYTPSQQSRPMQRTIQTDRSILIYSNAMARPLSDAALYMPIHEIRHIWQSPALAASCSVELQLMLSRTIWIAGTPIYISFKFNNMSKQKISSVKLELLRRQNTFSQTGLTGSFGLMPVTSTCEVVARVSAASFDWWQPIEQGVSDEVTLAIQSPADHLSIRSQKLIDVSYSIRVSIASITSTDAVLEIPVILVHPISINPPPGDYLPGDSSSETKDAYRRLCVDIFRDITPISNSSSESDVPSLEPATATTATKSTASRKSSTSSLASSIKPFRKMRRNISQWISQNNHHNNNKRSAAVTSPVAATTGLSSSLVRHGSVRSPKQFGTEPDSMGDAGLDIRHKLNVATAREAWEGYTAERCSLPRITLVSPTPERSVSLPSRWKAPSEKFEIGSSFNMPHEQQQQQQQQKDKLRSASTATTTATRRPHHRYPLNAQKGIKRMLASSRYMKSLQSKTLSVAEDGRKLLSLSSIQSKNERRSAIAI